MTWCRCVQLTLHLDPSQREPAPAGTIVRGKVAVKLAKSTTIQCIRVNFYGHCQTSWYEMEAHQQIFGAFRRTVLDAQFTGSDVYLDQQLTLSGASQGSEDTCQLLQPGQYDYPFQFVLPRSCPSSLDGKYGSVKYILTAKLDRPRKPSQMARLPVSIISIFDLSTVANAFSPVTIKKTQIIRRNTIWHNEKTECHARLHHRGYLPGNQVDMTISLRDNRGRTRIAPPSDPQNAECRPPLPMGSEFENIADSTISNATTHLPSRYNLKAVHVKLVRQVRYHAFLRGRGTPRHCHKKIQETKIASNVVAETPGELPSGDAFYSNSPANHNVNNQTIERQGQDQSIPVPNRPDTGEHTFRSVLQIPSDIIPTFTEPHSLIKIKYYLAIKVTPTAAGAVSAQKDHKIHGPTLGLPRHIKLKIPILIGSPQTRNSLLANFHLIGQSLLTQAGIIFGNRIPPGMQQLCPPPATSDLQLAPSTLPDHPPPTYEESSSEFRVDTAAGQSRRRLNFSTGSNEIGPPPAYEETAGDASETSRTHEDRDNNNNYSQGLSNNGWTESAQQEQYHTGKVLIIPL